MSQFIVSSTRLYSILFVLCYFNGKKMTKIDLFGTLSSGQNSHSLERYLLKEILPKASKSADDLFDLQE